MNTKFRIWDKLYEVFFYGDLERLVFGNRTSWRNGMMANNPEGTRCSVELSVSTDKYIEAPSKVLVSSLRMDDAQFWTGRQDKNGIDIYVGDVVSIRGKLAQVKFGNFESAVNKVSGTGYYLIGPESYPESLDGTLAEIKGNVLQNPELLQTKS